MSSRRRKEVKHFRGKVWVSHGLTPGQGDRTRPVIFKLVCRAAGFQATERGHERQVSRSSSLSSLAQLTLEILVEWLYE